MRKKWEVTPAKKSVVDNKVSFLSLAIVNRYPHFTYSTYLNLINCVKLIKMVKLFQKFWGYHRIKIFNKTHFCY